MIPHRPPRKELLGREVSTYDTLLCAGTYMLRHYIIYCTCTCTCAFTNAQRKRHYQKKMKRQDCIIRFRISSYTTKMWLWSVLLFTTHPKKQIFITTTNKQLFILSFRTSHCTYIYIHDSQHNTIQNHSFKYIHLRPSIHPSIHPLPAPAVHTLIYFTKIQLGEHPGGRRDSNSFLIRKKRQ